MGNLCSKSANQTDNFSGPGRTVGSSTQPKPTTAPVPAKITTSTPGRTLGGGDGAAATDDARSAAARAAEVRGYTARLDLNVCENGGKGHFIVAFLMRGAF